jgi:hypothetical protein
MLHEARMMFELVQEAAEQKYFEAATQQQVEKKTAARDCTTLKEAEVLWWAARRRRSDKCVEAAWMQYDDERAAGKLQEASTRELQRIETEERLEKLLNDVWNVTKSPKSKKSQERYQTTLMTR